MDQSARNFLEALKREVEGAAADKKLEDFDLDRRVAAELTRLLGRGSRVDQRAKELQVDCRRLKCGAQVRKLEQSLQGVLNNAQAQVANLASYH